MKKLNLKEKFKGIGIIGIVIRAFLIWFVIAFLIYPNANLLINVFFKNGEFSTAVFSKLLSSERAMRSLLNSFILAVSLIITVNIVGTLLVVFTEYFDIKGAKILKIGYMSTLVYGGIVLCTGYKFIYGTNGVFTKLLLHINPNINPNWFTGYFAVIFIMTFACTSNHIIFLTNAIRGIDYQIIEAARNMGSSFRTVFFQIVMPALKPTFFAVTILTFLTGLGAMAAPIIVGGDSFQTINPMIIIFAKSSYSKEIASLLSIILGVVTIILLLIMNKFEKGGNYISISKTKSKMVKQKIINPVGNFIAHFFAYILFIIYTVPILLVIVYSLSNSSSIKSATLSFKSLTLENYKALFIDVNAFKPYLISIVYSLLAAIIVAIISILVSRIIHKSKGKFAAMLEYSMLIPWLLPGTLIALGLMTTYDTPRILVGNKVLIGTAGILLLAYVIVKIPFSLRMIKAAFFSVDESLEESARCMGASAFYIMRRVILPIILPSILSVIVLNFNSMLTDYDVTVFLYHPLLQPLGIVIKNASDEDANINAQVMSFVYTVVIMIISTAALYFTSSMKIRKNK
ncbi:MAG: iron ABC transporter permease [Clostridium sp.]|uniref:ABC transporter permease n=1 Tax=Clostridium sp. TaxID=1506 RepID=UPI0039E8A5F2